MPRHQSGFNVTILHTYENFKPIVGAILFLKNLVHDRQFFAQKRNDKKHQTKTLYLVLPKATEGNNQTETIQKIQQAFGDKASRQTQIKELLNRFKNGRMSMGV